VFKILSERLETKAELYLGKDQYSFRNGRGKGMHLQHSGCCTKGTWNILIKFLYVMLIMKKHLI